MVELNFATIIDSEFHWIFENDNVRPFFPNIGDCVIYNTCNVFAELRREFEITQREMPYILYLSYTKNQYIVTTFLNVLSDNDDIGWNVILTNRLILNRCLNMLKLTVELEYIFLCKYGTAVEINL